MLDRNNQGGPPVLDGGASADAAVDGDQPFDLAEALDDLDMLNRPGDDEGVLDQEYAADEAAAEPSEVDALPPAAPPWAPPSPSAAPHGPSLLEDAATMRARQEGVCSGIAMIGMYWRSQDQPLGGGEGKAVLNMWLVVNSEGGRHKVMFVHWTGPAFKRGSHSGL